MPRQNIVIILGLVGIFSTLFAPAAASNQSYNLRGSSAAVAQAANDTILTFDPVPIFPNDGASSTDAIPGPQILLEQLHIPALLDVDVPFTVEAVWSGDAATLDSSWEIVYLLRGESNGADLVSELDLGSTLLAGSLLEPEQFWISPELGAGTYNLSVLIRDPAGERAPLALALTAVQADGSYFLGTVEVAAHGPAPEPAASSAMLYLPIVMSAGAAVDELPASAVGLPDVVTPNATVTGGARGYLTTPQELRAIKAKADQGRAPYAANVRELLNHSSLSSATSWVSQSSISGSPYCSDGSQKDASGRTLARGPVYITDGSKLIYAKMLYANLTSSSSRAEDYARNARTRILDLVDTTNWGGSDYSPENQCVLYLSWYITGFIMAADLLEPFPQIWTTSDKRTFQRWLATQVYPKVAWASRARTNNWGSGGSYAAAMIADYVWDAGLTLQEYEPTRRSLSPGQAYQDHMREQLSRMSTTIAERDKSASRCLPYKGIQSHGGIPDELRRAGISNPLSMCNDSYLPSITGSYDAAYSYQMIHVETLIGQAELALRRGDSRLYNNMASDNSGSILRSIKFIIQNPVKSSASYDWHIYRKAQLYVAYRYYRDSAIRQHLYGDALRAGQVVIYGRLTHGFASDETPSSPPTVAPPTP